MDLFGIRHDSTHRHKQWHVEDPHKLPHLIINRREQWFMSQHHQQYGKRLQSINIKNTCLKLIIF